MHTSLLPSASLLMRSLGWALLYSLWQGIIIYSCLLILLQLFRNVSAQLKYYLSFVSLAVLGTWFVNTWISQWQRLRVSTVYITRNDPATGTAHTISVSSLPGATAQNDILHHIIPHLETYMPLITTLYMLGLLFMLIRFSANLWQVQRLRRQGVSIAGPALQQQLIFWQDKLGISRTVCLYLSDRINVPAMMGVLKPVILLPLTTVSQLTTDQLEAVLVHELAHIKRHDYLLNILQTVVETLLFFNPFVWWMSAIIRREREHCCDDIVLTHTSNALSYAKALARLESHRSVSGAMAMAATGNKNQLFNRIKRIMEMKKNSVNYSQLSIALAVIIALVVSVAWFTPSYAQQKKTDHDKDETVKKSQWNVEETYTFTDDKGHKKVYHSFKDIPADKRKLLEEGGNKHSQVQTNISIKHDDKKDNKDDGDMADIGNDISAALSSVDWDKIGTDIGDAMQNLHIQEISKQQYGHFIDSLDINGLLEKAMKEAKEAIKNIPDDKRKAELDERIQNAQKRIEIQIKKAKARKEEAEAKAEAKSASNQAFAFVTEDDNNDADKGAATLKAKHIIINSDNNGDVSITSGSGNTSNSGGSYEKMLDRMEDDGLIDRSQDFKIEKYDRVLYINSNEQPNSVYNKYKRYLTGKKVIIKGGPDRLKITVKE